MRAGVGKGGKVRAWLQRELLRHVWHPAGASWQRQLLDTAGLGGAAVGGRGCVAAADGCLRIGAAAGVAVSTGGTAAAGASLTAAAAAAATAAIEGLDVVVIAASALLRLLLILSLAVVARIYPGSQERRLPLVQRLRLLLLPL